MTDNRDHIPKQALRHKIVGLVHRSTRLVRLTLLSFPHRGNRWTRKAERIQDPAFWPLRDTVRSVWFKIVSVTFKRSRFLQEKLTATGILWSIIRVILPPVLFSCGFVTLLIWLDQFVVSAVSDSWYSTVSGMRPESLENAKTTLLSTSAQVSGVILGLYFATVGVVASTSYGDVPPELRSELFKDKIGGFYLRMIGFTLGACLFGLGARALGFFPGPITVTVLAVFSIASVMAFIPLAKRVYIFLSPEGLIGSLMEDIRTAVNSVSTPGILSKDQSIQAHHQQIAAQKLNALEKMVFVSNNRSHSASALKEIGRNAGLLLCWYSKAKQPIAITSQWYKKAFKHPSYLLVEDYQIQLALLSGTRIPLQEEPDRLWLERRVGEIIQSVIVATVKDKKYWSSLDEILELFYKWIKRSAHQFRVPEMEMGFQVATRIKHVIHAQSVELHTMKDDDRLYGLAIWDSFACAIPSAAGGLNKRLETLNPDQLLNKATKAAIGESRPIAEFPPKLRAIIESLRLNHSFERDVEGCIQTPTWFIQHHTALLLSADIMATFESLLNETEQWFPSQAKQLREEGAMEVAVVVIQRGLEAVSKLEVGAKQTGRKLEELKNWRREDAVGEEWTSSNITQWHERLRILRRDLINELVFVTPSIPTTPPTGYLPDSLGFAYITLCDVTLGALVNMDADTFERIYPVLARTSLKAFNRVTTELAESPADNALYYSVNVLLDVLDISGHAYLWKFCLGKDCFWDCVIAAWDTILSDHATPSGLIKLITLAQDYHRSRVAMPSRSHTRWQWKKSVRDVLENKGFALRGISSISEPTIIAIDPITAAYFSDWDDSKSRDLFFSEYFLRRPEAEGLAVPLEVDKLREKARSVTDYRADGRVEGGPKFFEGLW